MPATVRRELGFDLRRVQLGELPRDWKPIPSVGSGVVEIRAHVGGAFRLMYVARHVEGIYVLHVFQKKSRKTAALILRLRERAWHVFGVHATRSEDDDRANSAIVR